MTMILSLQKAETNDDDINIDSDDASIKSISPYHDDSVDLNDAHPNANLFYNDRSVSLSTHPQNDNSNNKHSWCTQNNLQYICNEFI